MSNDVVGRDGKNFGGTNAAWDYIQHVNVPAIVCRPAHGTRRI